MNELNSEIWILLDSKSNGGIESHVYQLAKALKRYAAVRVVLMKDYGDHPLVKILGDNDIACTIASQNNNNLFALCKKQKPAVIHTHGYKAGIVGRCVSKLLSIPLVSTYHAGEKPVGKVAIYDYVDRYTGFLSDHVFSISPKVSNRLPCQSELIENFVNDDSIVPYMGGDQVAFVGRLSYEKGPDIFNDIAFHEWPYTFHVYGDGPLFDGLQSNSSSNVVYHGMQADMNRVWQRIDLLLITSRYEGLPMAAIEAMSCGIPVLASRVGALDLLIDHGVNGWLVEPGDVPGFVHHLQKWQALDIHEKNTMRDNAIDKVKKNFSSSVVVPKYMQCYQRLAKTLSAQGCSQMRIS